MKKITKICIALSLAICMALIICVSKGNSTNVMHDTFETEPKSETQLIEVDIVDETVTTEEVDGSEQILDVDVEETFAPATPLYIEIDTINAKINYIVGETFDSEGIIVSVVYDDGEVVNVSSEECQFTEVDMSTVGIKTIEVTYNDLTSEYDINVDHNVVDIDKYQMYTNNGLNLRNGPGVDYEKLASIPINTQVTVVGHVADSTWVKIIYQDKEYYCSGNYLSQNKTVVEAPKPVDTNSYGSFVTGEPGSSSEVVLAANKYWTNNVPKWLRDKYVANGWKMVVSAQPLNQRFGYSGSIAAVTSSGVQTIYLDNRTSVMARAMIHELGHFVDCINGWVSCTDEFQEIFEAEKHKYKDPTDVGDKHHTSNSTEYFAEVFSNIIMLGKSSLGDVPETYNFVSGYIG